MSVFHAPKATSISILAPTHVKCHNVSVNLTPHLPQFRQWVGIHGGLLSQICSQGGGHLKEWKTKLSLLRLCR